MFSFLAHYYGWSFQEILKLPIKAFFAFYREGQKMEAREYRELLDISIVPAQEFKYYEFLRARYNGMIDVRARELPPKPPSPPTPVMDSANAKRLLKSSFANMKRGMGYG